jgi:hypothetical protein
MNVLADAARAARWLEAIGAAIPDDPRAVRARVHAALGSAICAALLPSGENERAARTAAARVDDALVHGSDADLSGCDPLALALVVELAGAAAGTAVAPGAAAAQPGRVVRIIARIEQLAGVANRSARRRALVARVLGACGDDGVSPTDGACALGAEEASDVALLTADDPALHGVCDAVEAFGLGDRPAVERERIGAALGARAFAALRTARGFELGTRLLRVVASERLDPAATVEGLAYLRRQQRLDGAFGHLPPRSPQTGDIRLAFHLPRTVLSLWAIHDALAPVSLVRRAVRELPGAAPRSLAGAAP